MKVIVLPVRDPELRESRPRASPVRAQPARDGGLEGMHAVSVELLRAPRKRPIPPAARAPEPPAVTASGANEEAAGAPAAVEIALPNGRIVRVPPGFSSADLERVLAIASGDERPPG